MAHAMKMTRGACGHMFKHYERAKDEKGEYIKFGNQDIDPNKTNQNYNLAPERISQGEFIKQRCSEVYCLNRKDVNVLCSWVLTKPKDLTSPDKKFFEETYKFLEKRYGKENIVSSYVHMDETTPHMHFAFVPVVYDKKKGIEKVSAKDCINKFELSKFHTDWQNHLDSHDIHCNVLNEATRDGNKSIEELKRNSAIENLQNALNELNQVQEQVNDLSSKRDLILGQIKPLNEVIESYEQIDKIGKSGFLGKQVTMSQSDATKLKEQAKAYFTEKGVLNSLRENLNWYKNKYDQNMNRISKLDEENINLMRENIIIKDKYICAMKVIQSDPDLKERYEQQWNIDHQRIKPININRNRELER